MLVGGVESMSRAHRGCCRRPSGPSRRRPRRWSSTTLGWRLVNPAMPPQWTVSLGEATEQLRERTASPVSGQDAFAARSHELAAAGVGRRASTTTSSVAVPGVDLARDESDPRRHHGRAARRAQDGLPPRTGRHRHRGQRLPAQRRRLCRAARQRGRRRAARPRAARAHRRPGRRGERAAVLRLRARGGGEPCARSAPASGGTTSARRAQRGLRGPVAGVRRRVGRSTLRSSTGTAAPSPSVTRSARPARASSARWPAALQRSGEPLGRGRHLHRRRPGPGRRARERDRRTAGTAGRRGTP